MKRILVSALMAAMVIASCKKDDTICYNNVTMGNIEGETIVSDQGNTFDIVEAMYDVSLEKFEYGRVILSCDVLRKSAENRFDIRLTGIQSVLTKEPINASTITPESEAAVNDPIIINELWYGGGYINMLIHFAHKQGSTGKHLINLVHDDTATSTDGTKNYTFILRHNAFGETPTEENHLGFDPSLGYVSFPIAGLIEGDKAKITIKWNTHPMISFGEFDYLSSEEVSRTYDWERTGYQQNASTSTRPTLKQSKCFSVR